ncbi:AAA family ATPase [Donghicola sp. XS_ASV15]|uniref:AAA family ATPase n=1 Tax=Donghicola sp. XS_ASV15 TaxID=3241295 RepID=UPI00351615B2
MDWEDLRAALPEDKARDLRETIGETLAAYGVTVADMQKGLVLLRDAEGRGMTWQTQSVSRQLLTIDTPAAWSPALPLAELGDGAGIELRRPADSVRIVALFEPPFVAAFRRKLALVKRKYPGWSGFGAGNDRFDKDERDYKLAAGRGLTAALRREVSGEALLDALAEAAKTNLLNWRLKDAFSPSIRRDEQAQVFGALLSHRDDDAAHPQAIADFIGAWRALNPDGSRDTARQIAEYLLFLCRPDAAIFFKHGVLHDAYYEATARAFPSSDAASDYVEELRFAENWREALTEAGHPPRDLLDVQSFLWVSHGGAAAPPPQTETPTQTPDAALPSRPKEDTAMKPLNTILYGPPGTGKTYATFSKAVEICDGVEAVASMDGDALRARYAALRKAGRIGFVTFHQSYSYEEFVEGLRPEGGADDAGFTLQPRNGALREIAELAERESMEIANGIPQAVTHAPLTLQNRRVFRIWLGDEDEGDTLFEESLRENHIRFDIGTADLTDAIFDDPEKIRSAYSEEGASTGRPMSRPDVKRIQDFRANMRIGDIFYVPKGTELTRAIGQITGDYEFQPRYEGDRYAQLRKVRWLWVDKEGIKNKPTFNFTSHGSQLERVEHDWIECSEFENLMNQGTVSAKVEALPNKSFVLVMDEINRANISKVFGELITLLEEDKRAGAENEVSVRLPYSGENFTLPANLHFLGTMNTADRSIALLDTALRRRFHFEETPPQPDLLKTIDGIDLPLLLTRLNQRIEYLVDRDHLIGHAFFIACKTRDDVDTVMRRKVIPLLAEYFHEDWEHIVAVLGGKEQGFIAKEALTVPPGLHLGMDEARYRYTVRGSFPPDAYAGLQA